MFRYSAITELEEISRNWGWFLLLGVFLMTLGILAMASVWMTTPASVGAFGTYLILAGLLEAVAAFGVRHSRGLLVRVLTPVLSVAIGTMMLQYPLAVAAGLTTVLACLFLTTGLLRTITAVVLHYPAWEWTLLESFSALILGALLWLSGPVSGLWAIGLLLGACMTFRGLGWLMFALGARHARRVVFV